MERAWGTTLRNLRESGETLLHAACANLPLVDFTEDTIEITCNDDATFKLLTKHRALLGPHVNIHRQKPNATLNKDELIAALQEIFCEKLIVCKQSDLPRQS